MRAVGPVPHELNSQYPGLPYNALFTPRLINSLVQGTFPADRVCLQLERIPALAFFRQHLFASSGLTGILGYC